MKKTLSILYGIDDRYDIVRNTVNVCEPYFDEIQIVNSGPIEFQEKLKNINSKLKIRQIEFYHGDKEFCWRAHYYGSEIGDWVMWLDSDERPSQELLDNIDNIIESCEKENKTSTKFLSYTHYYNDGKMTYHDCDVDVFVSSRKNDPGTSFLFDRFIQINDITNPNSVFGDHGFIKSDINHHASKYFPFVINHYKTNAQFAQTCTLTMFFNPLTHFSDLKRINETLKSEEFRIFEQFKNEEKVFTPNEFYKKVVLEKDVVFIEKFKKMCNSDLFKNSKCLFNGMYNWSVLYDLNFKMSDYYCGKKCCLYKEIQL